VAGMRSGEVLAQRCLSILPAAIVKERFNLLAGHVTYALAEHGADAVSLRQIAKFAGERNHAVVQYHFGTREDLVNAILEQRTVRIDGRRRQMIDELEASGRSRDVRAIVEAAVYPLAELLGVSGPGGEVYLVFLLQLRSARTRGLFPRIGPGVAGMSASICSQAT